MELTCPERGFIMASLDTRYMKYFHEGVTFLRKLYPKYDMRMLNSNQCCVQVVKPSFDWHAHFVTEVVQNVVPLLHQLLLNQVRNVVTLFRAYIKKNRLRKTSRDCIVRFETSQLYLHTFFQFRPRPHQNMELFSDEYLINFHNVWNVSNACLLCENEKNHTVAQIVSSSQCFAVKILFCRCYLLRKSNNIAILQRILEFSSRDRFENLDEQRLPLVKKNQSNGLSSSLLEDNCIQHAWLFQYSVLCKLILTK